MPELEDEMCLMTRAGFEGRGSPDRVDALVWALTDGLLEPAMRD
jgi:phage terminase large subunit-like protein